MRMLWPRFMVAVLTFVLLINFGCASPGNGKADTGRTAARSPSEPAKTAPASPMDEKARDGESATMAKGSGVEKSPEIEKSPKIEKSEGGPFDYRMMTLDNGLKVVTLEDHSCPLAAVQLWYHVGSKNERPNRHGFAHMFEHMMFRGTNRIGPEEHFDYIRRTGGSCNAYTSFDQTVYVQTVPSNQVEMVFWLESERLAFLKVDEEGFATERDVVAEEYRMGAEEPFGTVPDQLLPQVFPDGTYSWSVIGKLDDLYASTSEDLQKFWETYYVPNNACLVVVGDIEHERIQSLAQEYFGWIPRYPDPPGLAVKPAPMNTHPMKVTAKEKKAPVPVVGIAYRTVPSGHPDMLYLEMLGSILGGGESSRLYKRLVLEDESAMVAMAGAFGLEKEGLFGAGAIINPLSMVNPFNTDKADALKAIREEIKRLKEEGPTEAELLKAKNNALRSAVTSQLTAMSKAQELGSASLIFGDTERVNRRFDRIRSVTRDDLIRMANTYLLDKREIEVEIKPSLAGIFSGLLGGSHGEESEDTPKKKEKFVATKDAPPTGKPGLEKIRPDFGALPPEFPLLEADLENEVHECRLENGLKVVVIPNHEIPYVTFSLGLLSGAYTEPAETPGTAAMAAQMLTRGTEKHSYEELAEILDTYAISIAGSMDMDTGSVYAGAVSDEAERAMEYLAEVVLLPTFPEKQFDILKKQISTGKAVTESSPSHIADREFRKLLFGDHPYARSADGESKDLDHIEVDGMKAWWDAHVQPSGTVLYMAGDVAPKEGMALAEKYFGSWPDQGVVAETELPLIPEPKKTHIYLVDHRGDQAQIRVGQLGITRGHPSFFTTRVLNDVFGGGFNSRLNKTVRVEKGLTYGVRGGFRPNRFAGQFQINTFTKNASVGEAVKAILGEIRRLKEEPPSAAEMKMAKNYLMGSLVINRETPQAVVGEEWRKESEGLPNDYMKRFLAGVRSTRPQDVADVAKNLIDENRLTILVVGSVAEIKDQLEAIAPVTVIELAR